MNQCDAELKPLIQEHQTAKKTEPSHLNKENILQQPENRQKQIDLKTYSTGILCAFMVYLCLGASKICVQALENRMEHFSLNAMRHACSALCSVICLLISKTLPSIEQENIKTTIACCVNLTISSLSIFVPVVYLPLASVECISETSTILFALVIFGLIIRHDKSCLDVSIHTIVIMFKSTH